MDTTFRLYKITFLDSDRFDDEIWFKNPKVGEVVKIPMADSEFYELEYWTIVEIVGDTVKVVNNEPT